MTSIGNCPSLWTVVIPCVNPVCRETTNSWHLIHCAINQWARERTFWTTWQWYTCSLPDSREWTKMINYELMVTAGEYGYRRGVRTNPAVFERARMYRECSKIKKNMRKIFTAWSSLLQQSVDHCNSGIYFSQITTKAKEVLDARLEGDLSLPSAIESLLTKTHNDEGDFEVCLQKQWQTQELPHNLQNLMWGSYTDHLHLSSAVTAGTPICGSIDGEFATS